jgi:hypothetical protein
VEGSGRDLFQGTCPEIAIDVVENHDKSQSEWLVSLSRIKPCTTRIEVRYVTM